MKKYKVSTFKKYYEKTFGIYEKKVPCPDCGFETARSNMSAHKRSSRCKSEDKMIQKEKELKKRIKQLEKLLNK